jgi:polar amino acid transport system substrate-binding protein
VSKPHWAALALLVAWSGPALASAAEVTSPPLRWAADDEGGAPYIFKDPKDPKRNIGFEVDLIEALARELGRPIVFKRYDYKSLLLGLERRDFDFAMNGIEVTPDRLKKVRFSRPYYVYKQQLVVRRGETRFRTLEGCKTQAAVVGTLEETAAERLLDRIGVKKKIYDGQVEPYRELASGRIDAVLLDWPIAQYYARPDARLEYAGPPQESGQYAIAFRKDDEPLATAIDGALGRLIASGELRKIYEKWQIWNDDQAALTVTADAGVSADSARQWTFERYFPLLAEGAWTTIQITLLSMLLAMGLGLPIALLRLYGHPILRALALVYVEFFRGIPVLLLLYFLYYGLPEIAIAFDLPFSLRLDSMEAAVLGFGLNYAAYESEIYRAGISSVPIGQWEAAASLGMPRGLTFRRIVLPQAVRVILPPMTNDFVALFKETSVVSIIAVVELSKYYQILSKSSLKYLEIGIATAALYLLMSVPLGALSRALERRWGKAHA